MTKSEHKSRIKKQRKAFESAHHNMEKIWNMRDKLLNGSVFKQGLENLDAELRYKVIKEDLELFLQEAMDDGYPELTI